MRISDWSSDVCSSDLQAGEQKPALDAELQQQRQRRHADQQQRGQREVPIVELDVVHRALIAGAPLSSEERRGGEECVRTCSSRRSPYHQKKNIKVQTECTRRLIYCRTHLNNNI